MENTFESIIESMKKYALSREVVSPEKWLAGAVKLNVLMESEVESLIIMEFELAKMRQGLLEKDHTSSYTKMMIEANPLYKDVQIQKARIKNAQDTILLAKKYATLSSDQMRSGL